MPRSTPVLAADDVLRARYDAHTQGRYEVYYVTASLGEGRVAWLRWTLTAPPGGAASAAVWAVIFDPAQPRRFAGRNVFPAAAWRPLPQGGVAVGEATVTAGECRGEVHDADGRRARWSLRWTPTARPFAFFPAPLERMAATATYPMVVAPAARAAGHLELDGQRIEVRDGALEQSHLYGGRHAHRWGWLHALGFEDDPDGWLVGVWAVPQRAGGRLPAASSLALRHRGREVRAHGLGALRALRWEDVDAATTRCRGRVEGVGLDVTLTSDPRQVVGVTYHDPDGATVYCAHSGLTRLEGTIGDRAVGSLVCSAERGGRSALSPEVWHPL